MFTELSIWPLGIVTPGWELVFGVYTEWVWGLWTKILSSISQGGPCLPCHLHSPIFQFLWAITTVPLSPQACCPHVASGFALSGCPIPSLSSEFNSGAQKEALILELLFLEKESSLCWVCSWEDVELRAASKWSNVQESRVDPAMPGPITLRANKYNCLVVLSQIEEGFLSLANKRFQASTNS